MTPDPSRKIGEPMLGLTPVAVVERSPTGLALIGPILTRAGLVIAALAAVGQVAFGAMLPAPWAVTGLAICSAVTAACVALGIASPGIRAPGTNGAAPVVESPRVGPQQ